MKFTYFISRPVFAWVISILMIVIGAVSYFKLSVREYPQISNPVITVQTKCAGYSAEVMEMQVTKVLENGFSRLEKLKYSSSRTEQDNSTIKLVFEQDVDMNSAYVNVLSIASGLEEKMPSGFRQEVIKADKDGQSISIALYGGDYSTSNLYDYSVKNLESYFASIDGVASVESFGGSIPEMHLLVDIHYMNHYGVSITKVLEAVYNTNINKLPIGRFIGKDLEFSAKVVNDLSTPEDFNNMIISSKGDMIVRFSDVGYAKIDSEQERTKAYINGVKCIWISIIPQPTSNIVDVSKQVDRKIKEISSILPKGMEIKIMYDRSVFIENSIKEVYKSIFEAIILVALTIFLFLRSFRASIIPLVTIPICLISTFAVMTFLGFSINTLTLLALVLGVGLLVDDAIVVVENIYRYIEEGENPFDAAIKGFSEISSSVIAMTFTLAAVYIPVVLSSGVTGLLFKEFALTLASCVIISGIVAVTLSPMMCSRLLMKEEYSSKSTPFSKKISKIFEHVSKFDEFIKIRYDYYLSFVMSKRREILIGVGSIFALSLVLFYRMPTEFSKKDDQNMIYVIGLTSSSSTIDSIHPHMMRVYNVIKNYPEVEDVSWLEQKFEENYFFVKLKDSKNRKRSCFEIQKELSKEFQKLPSGVEFFAYCPSDGLGSSDKKQESLSFFVQSNGSYEELISSAVSCINAVRQFAFVQHTDWNLAAKVTEYKIVIDQEKIASFGVDVRTLADEINTLVSGRSTTTYGKGSGLFRYNVRVLADKKYRVIPSNIMDYSVKGIVDNRQIMIPIRDLVSVDQISFYPEINHFNAMRSISQDVSLKGVGPTEAYNIFQKAIKPHLPEGVYITPGIELKKIIEETNSTLLIFFLAIIFVFLIMAAQFESFISPLIIMFTVPLALCGGVIALFLLPSGSINIFSNIGFITLIGLVTKHGILLVDFADKLFLQGRSVVDSIMESCKMRLRPILMTTFAMVLGSFPLAIATGPGSAVRRQLGWVIVGGMSLGTLFTLFFLPIVYTYIKPLSNDYKRRNNLK